MLAILCICLLHLLCANAYESGVVFDHSFEKAEHIASQDMTIYRSTNFRHTSLPTDFDWRDVAPLHDQMTQRLPSWCGSCYVQGTISAMTDRMRIKYPRAFRNRKLSTQAVMNCAIETGHGSCNGGMIEKVAEFLRVNGTVDETCMVSTGSDRAFVAQRACTEYMCRECTSDGTCRIREHPEKFKVSSWGLIAGAEEIQQEMYKRGPVACYVWTHLPAFSDYQGGIINSPERIQPGNYTHVITLIGWGEDRGEPYWTFRNWAGSAYGEDGGFGRIHRGNNTLNVEHRCMWVEPVL